MNSDIALVEFSTGHAECLYSQILFLERAGYGVHVIVPEALRCQLPFLDRVKQVVGIEPGNDFRSHWRCVFHVVRYLQAHGIRRVVFNTAEGNHVRDFCLIAPAGMALSGNLHHVEKLNDSFTQWLISLRVRKYVVLNDYLLEAVSPAQRGRVASCYLVFFPPHEDPAVQRPANEFWVGIPGTVEFRRRDYAGLLDQLARHRLHPSIRFIVLGDSGLSKPDAREVRTRVRDLGVADQFHFFDAFIPQQAYLRYVQQCSCLLPLIHPASPLYEIYRKHQISGAFNLAIGFAKPMLMHTALETIPDFQQSSLFYEVEELIDLLNRVADDESILQEKRRRILSMEKFSFDVQCDRFIRFLQQESFGDGS